MNISPTRQQKPIKRHLIKEEPDEYSSTAQYLLWSCRLKATSGRIALVELLEGESKPISIADIQDKLKEKKDGEAGDAFSLSSANIYRALEAFVSAGLVSRINTGSAHASYELISGRKHHHHVICTGCGDMEDVDAAKNCLARKAGDSVLKHSERFASVSSHSLEFFGICNKCETKSRI